MPKPGKSSFMKHPPSTRVRAGCKWTRKTACGFGEYQGNRIAMLDTKTGKFTEWLVPTPWSGPYDVTWDKNGELWTGGMTTDRVVRFNPKTSQTVEYLMPTDTNIRRVFVDNSTTPVTFWTGSNHGAAIVKVEPLD